MALTTDRERGAHLLRRFGLGSSEAELDHYLSNGLSGALDKLLADPAGPDGFDLDAMTIHGESQQQASMTGVTAWWAGRLLATQKPLRERLTVFWHDHFATSALKVKGAPVMLDQNEILRAHAVGSFRTMLHEVSKDPAMLFWLDNQENLKGKPNENFAREVMELFTLGVGHYTETDVKEAARAFTGWSYVADRTTGIRGEKRFVVREKYHDDGEKTVLGKSGRLSGDDVLDVLLAQPRCAEFLATKFWSWFVYPDPSPSTVAPVAKAFRDSDYSIEALVRATVGHPEFYSAKAERAIVKNPVDFCVATLRQLGAGRTLADSLKANPNPDRPFVVLGAAGAALNTMKDMGMWLMYPPDVAGWEIQQGWISTSTMLTRMNWAERLFGGQAVKQTQGPKYQVRLKAWPLLQGSPTASGAVDRFLSLYDADLKPDRRAVLLEAARKAAGGDRITAANADEVAVAVSRLIFACPEFQFC